MGYATGHEARNSEFVRQALIGVVEETDGVGVDLRSVSDEEVAVYHVIVLSVCCICYWAVVSRGFGGVSVSQCTTCSVPLEHTYVTTTRLSSSTIGVNSEPISRIPERYPERSYILDIIDMV